MEENIEATPKNGGLSNVDRTTVEWTSTTERPTE